MECITPGCSQPVHIKKRGLCRRCYAKWHKQQWKPSTTDTCSVPGCERTVWVKKRALCRTCYAHFHRHGVAPSRPRLDKTQHVSLERAAEILGCTRRKLAKMKERGELKPKPMTMTDVEQLRERWSMVLKSDAERVRKAYDWLSAECQACGKEFHRKPTRALGFYHEGKWKSPSKFCSRTCVRKWHQSRTHEVIRRHKNSSSKPPRHWVVSSDGVVVSRTRAETAWRLGTKRCVYCLNQFQPSFDYHQYCSRRCKRNHRNAAQRAKELGAVQVQRIGKLEVLRRDNWTCHLCGEHIDQKVQTPDPRAGTIDHLIPLSQGGTHTWDNLAAAHMRCNSAKGNRLSVPSLIYSTQQRNDAVPIWTLF